MQHFQPSLKAIARFSIRLAIAGIVGSITNLARVDAVFAELIPDDSFGSERSRVIQSGSNRAEISGGAQRGRNLFHSFQQFDVPDRGAVYFSNPETVDHIFTRITGDRASNILGTLGVNGNADLFLLNPNGVLFGENAQLDVRGAFLATTANAMQFGAQGFFDASTANPVPLLTVNPSALIFNPIANARIENRSAGLRVADGQSLLLVGGDVVFDQGRLFSAGSHIELGGLAAPGAIELIYAGDQLNLQFPEDVERSDVNLINQSRIDQTFFGTAPSDLVITARNINILTGTVLLTRNMGLAATDQIRLAGRTANGMPVMILNSFSPLAEGIPLGEGANVQITARSIALEDGATIKVGINRSDATDVEIRSQSLSLSQDASIEFAVRASSSQLMITVDRLQLQSGASISASTASNNNGGNITITANTIELSGSSANEPAPTSIKSETEDIGLSSNLGDAGRITLNARTIAIQDGAIISTRSTSRGQGGNIEIAADEVIVAGSSAGLRSGIFSGPRSLGIGAGNGGDIDISTRQLAIRDGAIVSASTIAGSDGGHINIEADTIHLSGSSADGEFLSAIASESIGTRLSGDAGDINIQSGQLTIRGGALISTQTQTSGQAGDVLIQADRIVLSGASPDSSEGVSRSRISSSVVTQQATGNAGSIVLRTRDLRLDGSGILAFTAGRGNAGNIVVRNADAMRLRNGATISTTTETDATGDAGNISLNTNLLELDQGSTITSSTSGQGNTGTIAIRAIDRMILQRSSITSSVNQGAIGGSQQIFLAASDLWLKDDSEITAATAGNGSAGDIHVVGDRASLLNSTISTQVERSGRGEGGNISINVSDLRLNNDARITANTNGQGQAGDITVSNADRLSVDHSTISSAVGVDSTGRGGNIRLQTNNLHLDQAQISARTQAQGRGGNIAVHAGTIASIDSNIVTRSANSSSGNVALIANTIRLRGDSDIRTQVDQGTSTGGNITLSADSIAAYSDSDIVTRAPEGQGGDITIDSPIFLAANYIPGLPEDQDNNHRVNVDASGRIASGTVRTPDTSFIQNSLSDLPATAIDPDTLLSNSCIARTRTGGRFLITGTGGLPTDRPDTIPVSPYPTDTVRTESDDATWQPRDPIVEPQAVYQLPNGQLILSRECQPFP